MVNVTILDEIDLSSEQSFIKTLKWGWVYGYPALKNIAGLYEGAMYVPKDRYRPEKTCVMRSGEPAGGSRFCVVCLDAIAKKIAGVKNVPYDRTEFFSKADIFTDYDRTRMKYTGETRAMKIIRAQSTVSGGNNPENAIDPDYYSFWESELPSIIVFDSGKTMNMGSLFVSLLQDDKNQFAYTYTIGVSTDNKAYTDVYSEASTAPASRNGRFININRNARYVRITCTEAKPYNRFYMRDAAIFTNDIENKDLLLYMNLKKK
jgi:hypothetical protein